MICTDDVTTGELSNAPALAATVTDEPTRITAAAAAPRAIRPAVFTRPPRAAAV